MTFPCFKKGLNTREVRWARHDQEQRCMCIGLFISRTIVERHRGRLWAEPNEGHGATFSFSIPREPQMI
jgi:signal transduction histidine kinase